MSGAPEPDDKDAGRDPWWPSADGVASRGAGPQPGRGPWSGPPRAPARARPSGWAPPSYDGPEPYDDGPEPSDRGDRPRGGSRIGIGILIGLLAGLLVFGSAGYLVGSSTFAATRRSTPGAASSKPAANTDPAAPPGVGSTTDPAPAAPGGGSLPPYEQSQLAAHPPRCSGALASFVQPWLMSISRCNRHDEAGGTKLGEGEEAHVTCGSGAIVSQFMQYKTAAARDAARARFTAMNSAGAKQLTPGAAAPSQKKTAAGNITVQYVEFAYTSGTPAHTVAGVWWDHPDAPVGAYLIGDWVLGLGESWTPLRDVWQRAT